MGRRETVGLITAGRESGGSRSAAPGTRACAGRSGLLVGLETSQRAVDLGLEGREGLRPAQEDETVDLARVLGVGEPEDEARRAGGAGLGRLGHIAAHPVGDRVARQAGFEGLDVEAYRLGMTAPRFEGALVGEQPVVHLPEPALGAGALGGHRGLEGQRVDALERKVERRVPQLAGVEVFLLQLLERLTDVSGAVRSLIVREVDQRESSGELARDGVVRQIELLAAHIGPGRTGRCRRRSGSGREELTDLLQLFLNVLLAALQVFYLAAQVGVVLRESDRRQKERQERNAQARSDALRDHS